MSSIGAGIGTELEGITENHSGLCDYVCGVDALDLAYIHNYRELVAW